MYRSNKFWKKFDALALTLHSEIIVGGSQKLTRHLTREMIQYIGEKHRDNQTTVNVNNINSIHDIWENIYKDFQRLDLNAELRQFVDFIEERSGMYIADSAHHRQRNETFQQSEADQRSYLN